MPAAVSFREGTRVVVTGGAGFVGSTLVDLLLARGCQVVVLDDLSGGSLQNLPKEHPRLTVSVVRIGDQSSTTSIESYVAGADAVFHLASPIGVHRAHAERFVVAKNILDSGMAIVDLCLRNRRPLLFTSSSEVYGSGRDRPITEDDPIVADIRPRWGYAIAKAALEHLVAGLFLECGVPAWIVRPFNMAGARQQPMAGQVIPVFAHAAIRGEPIVVHDDGRQRRAFLHVSDAVEGLVDIMQCDALMGRPVNLGGTETIRIGELAQLVADMANVAVRIVERPSKTIFGETFVATRDRFPDISLLTATTGWRPTRTMRQAVAECIEHLAGDQVLV